MSKAVGRKIDVAKALELRIKKGMSYSDIGQYFGCSKQGVEKALSRYIRLLHDDLDIEAYETNKASLLSSLELELLTELVDPNKRQKATLGNVAYALDKVNNINRLQRGQATEHIQYVDLTSSLDEIRRKRAQLIEQIGDDV